jgi:hypothetical protein
MFCGYCGEKSAKDDLFCRKCGEKLTSAGNEIPSNLTPDKKHGKLEIKNIVMVASLTIIILGSFAIGTAIKPYYKSDDSLVDQNPMDYIDESFVPENYLPESGLIEQIFPDKNFPQIIPEQVNIEGTWYYTDILTLASGDRYTKLDFSDDGTFFYSEQKIVNSRQKSGTYEVDDDEIYLYDNDGEFFKSYLLMPDKNGFCESINEYAVFFKKDTESDIIRDYCFRKLLDAAIWDSGYDFDMDGNIIIYDAESNKSYNLTYIIENDNVRIENHSNGKSITFTLVRGSDYSLQLLGTGNSFGAQVYGSLPGYKTITGLDITTFS